MTDRSPVSPNAPEVVVVGSINLDISVTVERFPEAGETVVGGSVLRGGGGKGANQAVAAARLGRRVAMIGRVGDDAPGNELRTALADEGIDVSAVSSISGEASGLAVIEVDARGENRIVVASGANATVEPADLESSAAVIGVAPVVLAQMEVPLDVVHALAAMPRQGLLIVNPAPAVAGFKPDGIDVLVPNRGELAGLLPGPEPAPAAVSIDEVVDQAMTLAATSAGLGAIIVTLGEDGAVVIAGLRTEEPHVHEVPAVQADVVDTTAAGDSFCGALADALCMGADLPAATQWAVRVAAVTVTRRGAQASLPHRSAVVA